MRSFALLLHYCREAMSIPSQIFGDLLFIRSVKVRDLSKRGTY